MPGEAIGRALIRKALMKYWGQNGATCSHSMPPCPLPGDCQPQTHKSECLPALPQNWRCRFNPWHLCRMLPTIQPLSRCPHSPLPDLLPRWTVQGEALPQSSCWPGLFLGDLEGKVKLRWGTGSALCTESQVGPRNLAPGHLQSWSHLREGTQAAQEPSHHTRWSWI